MDKQQSNTATLRELKEGTAICRRNRRCDVVVCVPTEERTSATLIRPMTFWESIRHELFEGCHSN
jgi:hypothetical protein